MNDKDKTPVSKPIPAPAKPNIPICSVCKKPFTQCQCEHNNLKK